MSMVACKGSGRFSTSYADIVKPDAALVVPNLPYPTMPQYCGYPEQGFRCYFYSPKGHVLKSPEASQLKRK